MALIAAVTEEIEGRGYLIERLEMVTGSTTVAALGTFVTFLALHATLFGGAYALGLVPWAVVLIGLYLWRRNLSACILMHLLEDGIALVLGPILSLRFR
jgi:uncharacterized protein